MDFLLKVIAYFAGLLFFSFVFSFPIRLLSENLGKAFQGIFFVGMFIYSILYYVFNSLKEFFILLFTFFKVIFCG